MSNTQATLSGGAQTATVPELQHLDIPMQELGTVQDLLSAQREARNRLSHPTAVPSSEITVDRDDIDAVLLASAQEGGGNHVLLYGPRGTGKTTTAARAAFIGADGTQQQVYSVTLTSEQSAASLWGHYIPKGKEFIWQDGPFLTAWKEGGLLIINEVDHASEDVRNMLNVLLDNPEVAKQTLPTGETVHPAAGFRCIATMNGYPTDLDEAIMDRFSLTTLVDRPSNQMFDSLPEDVRTEGQWQYAHIPEGDDEPWLTFRELQMFAKLRSALPEEEAARLVWGYDSTRIEGMLTATRSHQAHAAWEARKSGTDPEFTSQVLAWKKRQETLQQEESSKLHALDQKSTRSPRPTPIVANLPARPERSGLFGRALHEWEDACEAARQAADEQNDAALAAWQEQEDRQRREGERERFDITDHYDTLRYKDREPVLEREPEIVHAQESDRETPEAAPIPRDDLSAILRQSAHLGAGMHALFFGPPGTGKTTASYHAAGVSPDGSHQPVYVTTLTSGQSAASLWGHWVPKGDEFVWHDGPFLKAWKEGALLVISEIDHASEDVSNMLHVLLDNPDVAKVTLPTGETVRPKDGFRCIASMNGTIDDLAPAVLDRFAIITPILEPSTAMIDALPDYLRPLARYVYSEKNTDRTPEGSPAISYRTLEDFARLSTELPEPYAASLATKGDVARAQSLLEAAVAERTKITQQALTETTELHLTGRTTQHRTTGITH